ncbi:hypothetical protein HMPREF9578_02164 [Cutibacterium acnes HL110PA4]|nr:hypothetical protein HMPREF9603_00492 [Cutibacterium acnes HL001PA1]EFT27206.1 hypothetical protein HMPREF9577_00176 [Cutibacterium acnes HL110PA3]EFT62633.1 hypothetical protein HMPREF9578_02164 [Cutibacterium acnes HL110PA4]
MWLAELFAPILAQITSCIEDAGLLGHVSTCSNHKLSELFDWCCVV